MVDDRRSPFETKAQAGEGRLEVSPQKSFLLLMECLLNAWEAVSWFALFAKCFSWFKNGLSECWKGFPWFSWRLP
jgi:hypothetical protein